MSLADKAELLTPLKHLEQRRRSAIVFGSLLTIGVLALATVVLSVNDGRNYRRLVNWLGAEKYIDRYLADFLPDHMSRPLAAPASPILKSRRVASISSVTYRLIDPGVTDREKLQPRPRLSAYERCERLAAGGAPAPTFQAAGGEWECLFSHELGTNPEPSVLFIQIKGVSSSEFRTFRLKLNRLDSSQNDVITSLALAALDNFGLEISHQDRSYVYDRIKVGEKFSSRLGDFRISLDLERGDSRRLNIIIAQKPYPSGCDEQRPLRSTGAPMRASFTPISLSCLPLEHAPSSHSIQPD